jgi:Tfp pilus assembly protein PilX
MKTALQTKQAKREGSILAYFILVLVAFSTMAGLAAYVTQTTRQANRRSDMIAAQQYAEAGAVIACSELNRAVTNKLGTLATSLATNSGGGYTRNDALSTTSTNVYERTIASPFTNQTVKAQIWLPTAPSPLGAKVVGVATTRQVTQQAAVNVKLSWAYPAAIISTGTGTASTGLDKGTAQDGKRKSEHRPALCHGSRRCDFHDEPLHGQPNPGLYGPGDREYVVRFRPIHCGSQCHDQWIEHSNEEQPFYQPDHFHRGLQRSGRDPRQVSRGSHCGGHQESRSCVRQFGCRQPPERDQCQRHFVF